LALILEALREAVNLVEQSARHFSQRLGLRRKDADGFHGLSTNLI
jgi:hypothetical protein